MTKPRSRENLPTGVLRTLVAVAETGSLTKAASYLGVSQPAISSQMKQMQTLLGDPLLHKTPNGSVVTEFGAVVLELARAMLELNDRILHLGGVTGDQDQIRLGLSSLFIDRFASAGMGASRQKMSVVSDRCGAITQAFCERSIDMALVLDVKDHRSKLGGTIVDEFDIDFAWIKSREFVFSAGRPIPLAVWPGDQFALDALSAKGCSYRVMFTSPDYFSKFSAVKSGQCVTLVPRIAVAEPFVEAKEYHLPKIATQKVLLAVHGDATSDRFKAMVSELSSLELN